MMISTKGRYALRIMVDLAKHQENGFVSLKEIAERQGISLKYLEMIVGILTRDNFVTSMRGKNGGYKLNRTPEEYTVGAILRATEGGLSPVKCEGMNCSNGSCDKADQCVTMPIWANLDRVINNYLDSVTISDLLIPTKSNLMPPVREDLLSSPLAEKEE